MPFESFRKLSAKGTTRDNINFDHLTTNKQNLYQFRLFTNDGIREGTWALESPLIATKSWRTHHQAIRSFVMEIDETSPNRIRAGIYIGARGAGVRSSTPNVSGWTNKVKDPPSTDGGLVYIQAGGPGLSGTLVDAMTPSIEAGTGTIILEAGEIEFRTPRLMWGHIRDDQKTRIAKLNLGEILLSLVPMIGSALTNAGKALYQWYPVKNEFNLDQII